MFFDFVLVFVLCTMYNKQYVIMCYFVHSANNFQQFISKILLCQDVYLNSVE